jgi:hypothetical protein
LKINGKNTYKIEKLIRNEALFYVCSDISKLTFENKKNYRQLSSEFGFRLHNLQYSLTKVLLKKTLFRNYCCLLKDFVFIMFPDHDTFQKFETVLIKVDLVCLKLNNKLYLKKDVPNMFLDLSYENNMFRLVTFLNNFLKLSLLLYRNDVN